MPTAQSGGLRGQPAAFQRPLSVPRETVRPQAWRKSGSAPLVATPNQSSRFRLSQQGDQKRGHILGSAAGRTLSFVDASGRNRSHAVTSAAAAKLRRLRAGDEVIVVLTGTAPMVQDVRLSQAAPRAPSERAGTRDFGRRPDTVGAGAGP